MQYYGEKTLGSSLLKNMKWQILQIKKTYHGANEHMEKINTKYGIHIKQIKIDAQWQFWLRDIIIIMVADTHALTFILWNKPFNN